MTNNKSRYGDGTIYQAADGRWRAKLSVNGRIKYFSGQTQAEVKKKMRQFKSDPLNYVGATVAKADTALYFRKWLDKHKKKYLKVSSYDRLDGVLRNYIEPNFSGIGLSDITDEDCSDLLVELKDRGLSYSTTKKVHDTMHDCFNYAVTKRELQFSPMDTVKMLPKDQFKTKRKDAESSRHLTDDEVEAYLTELNRRTACLGTPIYRYRDAFLVLLNTGMREGELIALDWSDIDFVKREISVSKTAVMVQKRNADGELASGVEQIIQESTKTDKSRRIIPMNNVTYEAMLRLKEQAENSEFVLPTSTGNRLLSSSLRKQYWIATKHCGIRGTSVHSLRHTFATRLFERGANVKDVSALLGHSSVSITYNTYIHVIQERKENVVKLLD